MSTRPKGQADQRRGCALRRFGAAWCSLHLRVLWPQLPLLPGPSMWPLHSPEPGQAGKVGMIHIGPVGRELSSLGVHLRGSPKTKWRWGSNHRISSPEFPSTERSRPGPGTRYADSAGFSRGTRTPRSSTATVLHDRTALQGREDQCYHPHFPEDGGPRSLRLHRDVTTCVCGCLHMCVHVCLVCMCLHM